MPTLLEQYTSIKEQHKDAILFFRLGDFYETFFEDAKTASRVLGITLTSRPVESDSRIPMAGVTYYAADSYIVRLVRAGYKVAVCEQMEDPKKVRGLVRREVVRVITPGTVLHSNLLDEKANNFLAGVARKETSGGLAPLETVFLTGLAFVDLSTGEFWAAEFSSISGLVSELERLSPSECILPSELAQDTTFSSAIKGRLSATFTPYEDWAFVYETAHQRLLEHFGTQSLDGFGISDLRVAIGCAGAVIQYLNETQKTTVSHINAIRRYSENEYMFLGGATERNLELFGTGHSLISVLDLTQTPMGARRLKHCLAHPLLDVAKLNERLDGVEYFFNENTLRARLRETLKEVRDIERILARLVCNQGNARDLFALAQSLDELPRILSLLGDKRPPKAIEEEPFLSLNPDNSAIPELVELIRRAIKEDATQALNQGGLIKDGFDASLDELRNISKEGKNFIAGLQRREIERTRISSLKIKFNNIFGYFIEVTKPNLKLVPQDYIRKGTTANGERFITPELKDYETKVLGAEEKIAEREYELFLQVRERAISAGVQIREAASFIARIDYLACLAEVARRANYTRPVVNEADTINIVEGRHPVLERALPSGRFVANDTFLDSQTAQILIITGPNMAGKSTYIRQVALIVLMAQMGSFVPAKEATIGIVDKLFTRVGAQDELARGQSTFMVEMNEAAGILNNATPRSLIVLDEVGRGTSTFDGVSIAWAIAEYIHNSPNLRSRTLFATHYHELTELELELERVKNFNVAVKEWKDDIIFLHKIVRGGSDKSYGIHVARLAGMPKAVIERAKEVLVVLESSTLDKQNMPKFASSLKGSTNKAHRVDEALKEDKERQMTFFKI